MRAFIIGSGPSLKDTPLDLFKNEVTFAMNQIHFAYEWTDWRPTYYLFYENIGTGPPTKHKDYTSYAPYVQREMESGRICFISEHLQPKMMEYTRYKPYPNVTYVPFRCCHDHVDHLSPRTPSYWHLPNLCHYGGTMHVALQQAFIMGYDPVYLVGVDLGFKPMSPDMTEDPNHFHPEYWTWSDNPIGDTDAWLTDMHQIAKREYDRKGRSIYNATLGGKLEVYERVDLLKVLEEKN